ncbi:thiolase-like protein, partial [Pelagophyceae sp. CCMP2097]
MLEELWRDVLLAERDCVTAVPSDRPHNGRPSAYLSASTIKGFDRGAFGVSAAEAAATDPQQRLFLECAAEALELAGRRPTPALPGAGGGAVGVFAAVETSDYAFLHQRAVDCGAATANAYCGTGWHGCIAPNRVSYVFDLRGPSVALNTACSSALTCVAVARLAILANECGAALVGGANLQLQPHWSGAFAAAGMLSPTHRCRFGDDAADGYVRGEGVGAVFLEPFDDKGRRPLALVSGVGVGQDGRSNGLTAPNPSAQRQVLAAAYENGAASRASVLAIEAHGTGTRLGDPIELGALGAAGLGSARPLRCASIKSNIGHLEGCSGLAGLVKATLVLHHGTVLPRSLHFKTPNAVVPWDKLNVRVVGQTEPFHDAPPRRAATIGVSSFGFGGALGHVALSHFVPQQAEKRGALGVGDVVVIPIAAHSQAALSATVARVSQWAARLDGVRACEIAAACTDRVSVAGGRKQRPYRVAVAVEACSVDHS